MKILCFSGSSRHESFNLKLIKAVHKIIQDKGIASTFINLTDYELPIYDGDLEQESGIPKGAADLQTIFSEHDALIIASPEYNGSFTPLLKNAIDWVTRPLKENPKISGVTLFQNKPSLLLASSPGALGGLRGLRHLRELLTNLGSLVIPQQLTISKAHEVFSPTGEITDSKQVVALEKNIEALISLAVKLHT